MGRRWSNTKYRWRRRLKVYRRFRDFRRGHKVQLRPLWWWLALHVYAAVYATFGFTGLLGKGLVMVFVGCVVVWQGQRFAPRWKALKGLWFRFTNSRKDASADTMLDRRAEGGYYLASLAASTLASVLLATYWRASPGALAVPGRLLVGALVTGVLTLAWAAPYWWHHFGGSWGTDNFHQAWEKVATNADLKDFAGSTSIARDAHQVAGGTELLVKLRAGLKAELVMQAGDELAGIFGIRQGGVTLAKTTGRPPNYLAVRIMPRDPWPAVMPHPVIATLAPTAPIPLLSFEAHPRVPLGATEDGTVVEYRLYHLAVVGASGKGKSIFLNALLLSLLRMQDMAVVILDPDRVSFSAIEHLLAAPIASLEQAEDIIAGMRRVVDYRLRQFEQLAKNGQDVETLPVSAAFPAVAFIIDEMAKVVSALISGHPDGKQAGQVVRRNLEVIVREGRKVRVFLVLAVQDPTGKEDFGSAQIKSQMETLGLGLKADRQQYAWGSLMKSGFNTTGFGPGEFLIHGVGFEEPRRHKGYMATKRDLRSVGQRLDPVDRPPFDPGSAAALGLTASAQREDGDTIHVPSERTDVPDFERLALPVGSAPDSARDHRRTSPIERVAVLLDEATEALRPVDVERALGMSSSSVGRHLARLVREGRAEKAAHGRYVSATVDARSN